MPTAVSVGNFDGVHAGHRRLLERNLELARAQGLTPAVLTFDPHPARVVAPHRAPRLLTTMAQRIALIQSHGIEHVSVLPFDERLSRFTPEEFTRDILRERLDARLVLVGENFRFGHGQAGNVGTLTALGHKHGFETEVVPGVHLRGRLVSSTEVRRLVEAGAVSMAARLLLRPYALDGSVVRGFGIGSKQTVPTLNLDTRAEVIPARGVYVTRTIDLDNGRSWPSITNIGLRPTFDGDRQTVETWLLAPLEGGAPAHIRVGFLRRVRDERKFETPEALKAQILRDASRANVFHSRTKRMKCPL